MTDKYTVIGHFDCGCGHGAQPTSLEMVVCSSREEVKIAAARMKQHAAGHQCLQEPPMAIVVVPGEPEIVHEVKQLPEAYLLFPDVDSYVQRHDKRKHDDAERGRGTRAELRERLKRKHGGA
jgi:hypothetical protein